MDRSIPELDWYDIVTSPQPPPHPPSLACTAGASTDLAIAANNVKNTLSCITVNGLSFEATKKFKKNSFIEFLIQPVCEELEDKDEDAEHYNIDQRVEDGMTVIGSLYEIISIGKG